MKYTESKEYPIIKKKSNKLQVPMCVSTKTVANEDGTTTDFYTYYLVEAPNQGQNELALRKELTLQFINDRYDEEVDRLLAKYPQREVDTFYKQLDEARKYKADKTASVPFIEALASERGLTVSELADRIIAKDNNFTLASGQLTGKRQRLEKAVNSATTTEEVEGIIW